MEKVKKFKEEDQIFEIINPYEERGRKAGMEIGLDRGREGRGIGGNDI